MSKIFNVLFFGPIPPKFHGQSIAFKKATEIAVNSKTIINTNLTGKSLTKKIILSFFIFFRLFYVFLFKAKPEIIYFTCSRSFFGSIRDVILLQFARLFNVPVVNHLHGADFKCFYDSVPKFYKLVLNQAYYNVQHSIVLTESMRSQFHIFPNMKISVVPNFYSKNVGLKGKSKPNSANVSFVFLSNIMKTKGIFLLLEAFKILQQKYPAIQLRIAGSPIGDYELDASDTSSLFDKYLSSLTNVNYAGVVQGDAKQELLNSSSVFVLPSYYKSEAIPLSIIEAMASGCAIITTDHNYLPSLVGQDNGLLVKPIDVESLVAAMERYITSPDLLKTHQVNNVEHASNNFSEDAYCSGIVKVIEQTLKDCR
ncbi:MULTISPECIES: glycosyltransferase family 4 protein [unclassified Marinobacterium]|uniref:glycosyltransferase family 4 protein n=1 Tax=unclassified Marinobacterium TaxID=2644139 RepID=UPI00156A42C9|nr:MULTISPECIES: glycosyltransferase family 4 protein [unclassified Marinobacterium]NRP56635.1 putative teichuronic acid biosynthesis glycosyltransferase TuaC [Marinobacterium sp. xm-d-510]NRP96576.1 putative teichuronic acid biosynthesis glycosyltransferase TuaC [Marinobacterium sp. xm-a-127]